MYLIYHVKCIDQCIVIFHTYTYVSNAFTVQNILATELVWTQVPEFCDAYINNAASATQNI